MTNPQSTLIIGAGDDTGAAAAQIGYLWLPVVFGNARINEK